MWWMLRPGVLVPFVGKRRLPVNRDGSPFDSGEFDLLCENAPFYVEIWAVEWFGFGIPIWPWAMVRDARTGEPI